jgi:two-component system, NarL family, sensor histidine kinase DesK
MTLTPGRVLAGRIFFALWVAFVLVTAPSIINAPPSSAKVAALLGITVYALLWVWFWLRALGSDGPAAAVGAAGISVLSVLLTLLSPIPGADAVVFGVVAAGVALPTRRAAAAVLGLAAVASFIQFAHGAPTDRVFQVFLNDFLVGLTAVGGCLLVQYIRQLESAREEIARLAVSEERLRFARDLHDLLGQNLAVVVLKSELVGRELPASIDPELRREVKDIAAVARKSLDDVREAVTGYRQAGLEAELASSRAALRAAGIGLAVEDTLHGLPGVQENVLAWAIREGVTNVVKHSHGTRCVVRLEREQDRAVLTVEDNGIGGDSAAPGSGLKGIAERVGFVGGTFSTGTAEGKGFRLQVAVPLLEA